MKNKILCFILLFVTLLFIACNPKEEVYTNTYKGQKVVIKVKEVKGFSTNRVTYYVTLGKHKEIPLDAFTTDLYGPPYSTHIFNNVPYSIFIELDTTQARTINFEKFDNRTMLYFNPKKYSKEDYDAYVDFFKNAWPDILKEFNKEYVYIEKDIVGLAYVEKNDLIQYFEGQYMNEPYYFEIGADGVIYLRNGVPPESYGFTGSGLASKVQAGNVIIIKNTNEFTPEKLKTFKDKNGKTLSDYFTIKVDTSFVE